MNTKTGTTRTRAIFTAPLVAALLVGGLGGYAAAKAGDLGVAAVATTVESAGPARAARWDHEERPADASVQRASRLDHEERSGEPTVQRASRWDHEERP